MLLSILIPSLESRRPLFDQLHASLTRQIQEGGWDLEVEILSLCDAGGRSIGSKRNELVERASGLFVAFVDDDDSVSNDYIRLICEAIQRNEGKPEQQIDCIGIRGVITFRGSHPRDFIHSLRYDDYFSKNHTYYRPPYHLNPMRREITARYRFADVSYSEDIDWALQIRRDRALKKEEFIDSPIYFYRSRRAWAYQWLLDNTETFRHKFGIRLANRLSIQQALRAGLQRWLPQGKVRDAS